MFRSLVAIVTVARVHFEMPSLEVLLPPLHLYLAPLKHFPSPRGRPTDMGPSSASC